MNKTLPEERVLNAEQKKAVEHKSGPLLIIAGAGTGKTTVVTERIKNLIVTGSAQADEILALTFTEKAAREMEERVDALMPYGYTRMWISTFHSFCDRILRVEGLHIGLDTGFHLLSDADSTLLIRKHLFDFQLDYFRPLGNPTKFIGGMLQHFSRLRDEDVTPKQYQKWLDEQKKTKTKDAEALLEQKKYQELADAYRFYDELKIKKGVMDFSDLVAYTLQLFRTRPNILKEYQQKFKYLLVDEFQDTNAAQNELVRLLAGEKANITVVADDDQSIYKFRGAAVSNVISFRTYFPNAQLVVLTKNYRSTQKILDESYRLIQHNNPDRLEVKEGIDKKLIAVRKDIGQSTHFLKADRVENEAELVVAELKKQVLEIGAYQWKDCAILVRANNHAEVFVRALSRHGIPFQFLGPGRLFHQPEIKELISYLHVLVDFSDTVSFYKLLSMEYFALNARDIAALIAQSKKQHRSLFEIAEIAVEKNIQEKEDLSSLSPETHEKLTMIVEMIHRHLKLVSVETAGQILYYFLKDTGMLEKIVHYEMPIDEQKAANITKFFNKLKTYESEHEDASVPTVLDWITLAMELGESPLASDTDWTENNVVNLLTIHSAKGLEFKIVFLVNLVAGRFPTIERREKIPIAETLIKEALPEGDAHEEEERRLFYVGMTRARDKLYFSAALFYGEAKREKKLSPFIYEALGSDMATDIYTKEKQLSLLDWQKEELVQTQEIKKTRSVSITYLSYSQIDAFRLCPLHYKLRYLVKIPSPPSPALAFGNSVHQALKDFYQIIKQKERKPSASLLLELLEKNWSHEGYTSKTYERQMHERGKAYLKGYFKKEFDPERQVLLLEQPFTVPITALNRNIKIGGRIDRVDQLPNGKIEIIDYKTGRLPKQREIDTSLQLSMYALAATLVPESPFNRKAEDIILSMYFFDSQEKMTTTRTHQQLEAEKEKIMQIAEAIEQSNFRCSRNNLCVNCEYKLFCGIDSETHN